jgi:hypothetical protein
MKKVVILIAVFFFIANGYSQSWTNEQLEKANTAKDIEYLSQPERDAIMYINLARLYPKQFAQTEVKDYYGPEKYGEYLKKSDYRKSLLSTLDTLKPRNILTFDKALYESAKCFSKESGDEGKVGHERKICPKDTYYAECCSYGMETGLDIALQWLIDHDVASLGHRINCLNSAYTKIGLSIHAHKKYDVCAVADMSW